MVVFLCDFSLFQSYRIGFEVSFFPDIIVGEVGCCEIVVGPFFVCSSLIHQFFCFAFHSGHIVFLIVVVQQEDGHCRDFAISVSYGFSSFYDGICENFSCQRFSFFVGLFVEFEETVIHAVLVVLCRQSHCVYDEEHSDNGSHNMLL